MNRNTLAGGFTFKYLKEDLPAALVVFLVAIPLCLGIALASGAPLFAGIIAGICGGLIVPFISNSSLGVSGPAAGLTAIVLTGIDRVGSYETFILAVVLGGALQICLGALRAGNIAYLFPGSVITGMLVAIGLILIAKQLPHAIGYNEQAFGLDMFVVNDQLNILSMVAEGFASIDWGALIICAFGLGILIFWERTPLRKFTYLPGALVVVVVGVGINYLYKHVTPDFFLTGTHLVSLPEISGPTDFMANFRFPDYSEILNREVWIVALSVGVIASVESLLTVAAVDKIDPHKRETDLNRELFAQGAANMVSGLFGGIPVTAVIARSTAAIAAGGRTKLVALMHGVFLLISIIFIGQVLNLIPLASLAAILVMVGYKLAKPAIFRDMYQKGFTQFIPFITTVVAILLTDLLIGISIGIAVSLLFVIRQNINAST